MSRFFTTTLISLLLIGSGACAFVPTVHAQTSDPAGSGSTVNPPSSAGSQTSTTAAGIPKFDAPVYPAKTNIASIVVFVMQIFAWAVGIAAYLLDYVVYITIVTMGNYVNGLGAIGAVWTTMSGLGNIILIFGFLAIGITTIINVDWYGGGTKMLPKLLIAAVLINFSLFIAEAIIDTGNLFATEIYAQINPQVGTLNSKTIFTTQPSQSNPNIQYDIMSSLQLATLYQSAGGGNNTPPTDTKITFIGILGIFLFLIAAFVLFALSFILIARFITLILLIICAPVAFAGWAVPKLSNLTQQWWESLIKQTLTGPVLLLLLYVALKIITAGNFLLGFGADKTSNYSDATSIVQYGSLLVSFFVAMGLLLAVIVMSQRLGASGASFATKTAGRLSFGFAAGAARTTVGWGSNYAAKRIRQSSFGGTKTGRIFATTLDRGAKASFDIRGTNLLKNLPGGGIDAGKAAAGGYRARSEKYQKAHEEYAKSLTGPETTFEQEKLMKEAKDRAEKATKNHTEEKEMVEKNAKIISQKEKETNDEIAVLEKQKEANDKFAIKNADSALVEQKLAAAQVNLEELRKQKTDANKKVADLKQVADELKKAQEDVNKAVAKETTDIGKKAQEAYGNNIRQLGLIGSAVLGFGPSAATQTAARKIIKEATKKDDKLETIKKALKDDDEESKEKKDDKPAQEPATPAVAAPHP